MRKKMIGKMCDYYLTGCIDLYCSSESMGAYQLNSFYETCQENDVDVVPSYKRLANRITYLRECLGNLSNEVMLDVFERQLCQKYS